MLVAKIENVKDLMAQLLKKDMFYGFQVRDISVTTFVNFEIHGALNRNFYNSEEDYENLERSFCLWEEIQGYAFELIKGSKLPTHIKIVFSAREELAATISENASALFINITFDGTELTLTGGSSQKSFSLDRSVDLLWDEWVQQFFERKGIALTAPEYKN